MFAVNPPCSMPHSSSALAWEFLEALQSATLEAFSLVAAEPLMGNRSGLDRIDDNNNDGKQNTKLSVVVMKFPAIIRESRERPQAFPFHPMKKVWTLIVSIASRCKDGEKLGNDLAAKFDRFLPDGYAMVSVNLFLLKGTPRRCTVTKTISGQDDDTVIGHQQLFVILLVIWDNARKDIILNINGSNKCQCTQIVRTHSLQSSIGQLPPDLSGRSQGCKLCCSDIGSHVLCTQ
jgi:hypothetical protein